MPPDEPVKTVAVIGLGSMGHGMAASPARAGFAVRGTDTRAEAAAPGGAFRLR